MDLEWKATNPYVPQWPTIHADSRWGRPTGFSPGEVSREKLGDWTTGEWLLVQESLADTMTGPVLMDYAQEERAEEAWGLGEERRGVKKRGGGCSASVEESASQLPSCVPTSCSFWNLVVCNLLRSEGDTLFQSNLLPLLPGKRTKSKEVTWLDSWSILVMGPGQLWHRVLKPRQFPCH